MMGNFSRVKVNVLYIISAKYQLIIEPRNREWYADKYNSEEINITIEEVVKKENGMIVNFKGIVIK